jgi:hypothetical protein
MREKPKLLFLIPSLEAGALKNAIYFYLTMCLKISLTLHFVYLQKQEFSMIQFPIRLRNKFENI